MANRSEVHIQFEAPEEPDAQGCFEVQGKPLSQIQDLQCSDSQIFILARGQVFVCDQGSWQAEPLNNLPSGGWFLQDQVVKMSVGRQHALFLTRKGRVFGHGANESGQLGQPFCPFVDTDELKFFRGTQPRDIAAGGWHSLVATQQGTFSFGLDNHIQLGVGDTRSSGFAPYYFKPGKARQGEARRYSPLMKHATYEPTPILMPSILNVRKTPYAHPEKVYAGDSFSLVQIQDSPPGDPNPTSVLFGFGCNEDGQCGRRKGLQATNIMGVKLPRRCNIRQVACGSAHALVLLETGEVFAWGRNREGQCGTGNKVNQCPPRNVSPLFHEQGASLFFQPRQLALSKLRLTHEVYQKTGSLQAVDAAHLDFDQKNQVDYTSPLWRVDPWSTRLFAGYHQSGLIQG